MNIAVSGSNTVARAPERATLNLVVGCESDSPGEAMRQATRTMNELHDELLRLKAADPSPTTWFAVLPFRTRSWRPWSERGELMPWRHSAQADVKVKFRDFAAMAEFVRRFGSLELVKLGPVEWTLTEKTLAELNQAVLIAAVQDARWRAGLIASAAGFHGVVPVEVADPGLLSGLGSGGPGGYGDVAMGVMRRGGSSDDETVDLAPEDIEVSATVHARFTAS